MCPAPPGYNIEFYSMHSPGAQLFPAPQSVHDITAKHSISRNHLPIFIPKWLDVKKALNKERNQYVCILILSQQANPQLQKTSNEHILSVSPSPPACQTPSETYVSVLPVIWLCPCGLKGLGAEFREGRGFWGGTPTLILGWGMRPKSLRRSENKLGLESSSFCLCPGNSKS